MSSASPNNLRWEYYLIRSGDGFRGFWESHLAEKRRNLLFVLGLGFDPRTCSGLRAILGTGGDGDRECLLVEYNEGANSPSRRYQDKVEENRQTINDLMKGRGTVRIAPIRMMSDDGRRIGGRAASNVIEDFSALERFTDIIVDIGAMPLGLYIPIVAKLLYLLDADHEKNAGQICKNLHVITAENVRLDSRIREEGIDETATYLHGFSSALELEATASVPKLWIPVLGEGKEAQLRQIYEHVKPDEISPIIPSPSVDPRRGDDLIIEYRELLFDRFRVEPRNIIYAAEKNPFEVYRQISRTITHYHDALKALDGCRAVVSAMSSKLLSIGALLASYELKQGEYSIAISTVESLGYTMNPADNETYEEELFTLWLAGECYDQ